MSPTSGRARRRAGMAVVIAMMALWLVWPGAHPGLAAAAGEYVSPTDPTVSYTVAPVVVDGGGIAVTGSGFVHSEGRGSVVAVLLDARFSGDPGTVTTTREVVNPSTGAVSADKRLHVIVQANAAGAFSVVVPFPTPANSSAGNTTPEWSVGSTHEVRLLTGSLQVGDPVRSLAGAVSVASPQPVTTTAVPTTAPPTTVPATTVPPTTAAPTTVPPTTAVPTTVPPTTVPPTTVGPPDWPAETLIATTAGGTATAWVQRDISAGDGATIRLRGTGWTDAAGTGGSTIAVKLNSGPSAQYTRSGPAIVRHPTAGGDDTIWILLTAEPSDHPNVHPIADDGSFDVVVDAPTLVAGQYLTALLQSGRFLAGDTSRSVTSPPLVVGGVPWTDDGGSGETVTCVPTSAVPEVSIPEPTAALGGTVRVVGSGWCHPTDGGSRIAIKIDEGAYSRPDTSLHQNRTIWAIIDAEPSTGDFDVVVPLPDGVTLVSEPPLASGSHTFRLLTGTLKAGDTVRTLLTGEFVVGEYRPTGIPAPPEVDEDLTDSTRRGVVVSVTAAEVVVTAPGSQQGDWVFVTAFDGTSPRYPWGERWFRFENGGVLRLPRDGSPLPSGTNKLALHSDRRDTAGRRELLGWGTLVVEPPVAPGDGNGSAPTTTLPSNAETTAAPAPIGIAVEAGSTAASSARRSVSTVLGASTVRSTARSAAGATAQSQRPSTSVVGSAPALPAAPASAPKPTEAPAAPAPDTESLTSLDRGDVSAVLADGIATVTLPSAVPSEWVFVYAYSTPRPAGWLRVTAANTVSVDVSRLGAGRHHLAALDHDGSLIGWAPVDLASTAPGRADGSVAPTDPSASSTDRTTRVVELASSRDRGLSANTVLIIAAAVVAVATAAGLARSRRRTPRGAT